MGLSNIEKKSFGFNIIRSIVRFWHNIFFYKSFIVLGKDNIPSDKPLIFTPNHQNALMDALALAYSVKRTLIFVARSDIFKKPVIARILYYIKILPIYRIRDGFDTVKKNQNIIRKTIDIINAGNGMAILPEGNHSGIRRLRPLKKGFARMAFQTEEANDFNLDINIVPVGIYYDNYQKYRSSLIVNFGSPVSVGDFVEEYKTNPAIAINKIKDKLAEHMKPLIINIESDDNYELYNELRLIYFSQMAQILELDPKDEHNRIFIEQRIIELLTNYEKNNLKAVAEFQTTVLKYANLRDKLCLSNEIIERNGRSLFTLTTSFIVLSITLPVFIYGGLNNFMAYWLPLRLSKLMKDPQFQSSFKFAISLFSFPIFYLIQSLLILLIFNDWQIVLLYLISLPISAALAWVWRDKFLLIKEAWKYEILKLNNDTYFLKMRVYYGEIIALAENILKNK
ncbi:MAG: lysophospholipid acyltransferase family protein [Bacteroidota bacterium]